MLRTRFKFYIVVESRACLSPFTMCAFALIESELNKDACAGEWIEVDGQVAVRERDQVALKNYAAHMKSSL